MKKCLAPALILSFIPKCPGCIAAYIALTTGVGVSFTTAAFIRDALLAICITSLVYWAARTLSAFRWSAGTRASHIAHGQIH
jgi:hypothetical protein